MKSITATPDRFGTQARIIKALAHPTRLFILAELAGRERCVQELTGMIGVEMPTVSRHLSVLTNAGILAFEKRGAQVFYQVRARCVLKVFECLREVQSQNKER